MPKSNKAQEASSDELASPPKWERYAIFALAAVALLLSSLPDIYGWLLSKDGQQYVGYAYNIDDGYVYMSWAHQAATGHFYDRNLFTTEHQLGRQFNVYFLLIGNLSRLTHLPLIAVFTTMRVAGGAALLWVIYRLYAWALPNSAVARVTAFALVSLGAGFGYFYARPGMLKNNFSFPVDTWQPEALTFMSLQVSSLFVVSTALIVLCMALLIRAERRQNLRDAVLAGVCALILGNIHSYDILHIAAAWGIYLIVSNIAVGKFDKAGWGRAIVAGLICSPTVIYQYYLYKLDPVFHARVETPTLSMAFRTYALGYGFAFALAIAALVLLFRSEAFRRLWRDPKAPLVFVCWVIAVFMMVYLPTSFQRKMIMGVHVPMCLLAGAAAAYLGDLAHRRWKLSAGLVPLLVVVLSLPSNLIWISREIHHLSAGDSETNSTSFLSKDDLDVYAWIDQNTKPNDAIVGPPTRMLFVPGLTGRHVWSGHWSETPGYAGKFKLIGELAKGEMADPQGFLEETKAQYLVWPNGTDAFIGTPSYLERLYSNATYTVYRIL